MDATFKGPLSDIGKKEKNGTYRLALFLWAEPIAPQPPSSPRARLDWRQSDFASAPKLVCPIGFRNNVPLSSETR